MVGSEGEGDRWTVVNSDLKEKIFRQIAAIGTTAVWPDATRTAVTDTDAARAFA